MRQKHQAFLIARVIPKSKTNAKYRCIAAIHHQWLYGILPLQATTRLIGLIKQPQNAMIIREELKSLHGKYGRRGEKPELSQVPAPYCMFLLQSAFYTDINAEEPVGSEAIYIEDPNMGSWDGDNNDGISVIDVTDPEDPRYCFIQILLADSRILSANGYVRGYHSLPFPPESYSRDADRPQAPPEDSPQIVTDPEVNQYIEELINQFSNIKLIAPHMLAEAWPDEYDYEEPTAVSSLDKDTKKQGLPSVPPLAQISLKPAVVCAMENDCLSALNHFLSDSTTRHTLKQIIIEHSALQSKSAALLFEIVARELESDSTTMIDLSDIALTSEQVIDILTPHQTISSLNLSRNPNVTAKTLGLLLEKLGNLHRLILFDTGITRDDLVALLKSRPSLFYQLSVLIHPALLNQMDEELAWASDYGHCNYKSYPYSPFHVGITLPFFSPAQVVRSILSLFAASRRADAQQGFFGCTPFFQAAYAVDFKDEERRRLWDDRLVPICPPDHWHASLLRLRGWAFLWDKPHPKASKRRRNLNDIANNMYAFIRFNRHEVDNCEAIRVIEDSVKRGQTAVEVLGERLLEVYDLEGFLDACVAEGRPPIPEDLRKSALECFEEWKLTKTETQTAPDIQVELIDNSDGVATIQTFRPMTSASKVLKFYRKVLGMS